MKCLSILVFCATLLLVGCDGGGGFSLGDMTWPDWDWDSTAVGSARIHLNAHVVNYDPGSTAEVSGYVLVANRHGQVLAGVNVSLCTGDSAVEVVRTTHTTDAYGKALFTLRSQESGGRVMVQGSAYAGGGGDMSRDTVLFQRSDRSPAHLAVSATPETLYVDNQHPDSARIQISLLDAQSAPIAFYSVECPLFGWNGCGQGVDQTDASGIITRYSPRQSQPQPATLYYRVRAGALIDTVVFTIMPWDSTR